MIDGEAAQWGRVGPWFLVLNGLMWVGYLIQPRDRAFRDATRPLRGGMTLAGILGLGHVVPLVLLAVSAGSLLVSVFALLGGILLKASLVLRAGQFRPVAFATGQSTRVLGAPVAAPNEGRN
ncbi:MAG: hypothetical protein HYS14_03085 [Candidatus Rokubacteria bacterium]|nr:hypothetical protein [Candidatus Rokubacteria bacterium]